MPSPICEPCETTAPVRPPITAPSTWPARAPSWNFWPLVACAVPCRSTTCAISCAITPAISPSDLAASIMPRCRNIGPPGSANALISRRLTTSKRVAELRLDDTRPGLRRSAGRRSAPTNVFGALVVQHRHLLPDFRRPPAARARRPAWGSNCSCAARCASAPPPRRQWRSSRTAQGAAGLLSEECAIRVMPATIAMRTPAQSANFS